MIILCKFYKKQNLLKIRNTLFYIFLLFQFSSFATAGVITVATGINSDPPYVYGDKQIHDKYPGITIEVLQLIEKKSNVKFLIKKLPWKRVIHEVKNNTLDGGFHFSFKEKRKSFVVYPITNGESVANPKYSISNRSYVIYKLKDENVQWDSKQIVMSQKIYIGVIRGSSITDKIISLNYKPFEVATDLQLITGLLKRRYSAFIALENMLDPKINHLKLKENIVIEKLLPVVVNKPYYIAFSKKFYQENSEIAWKIWNTIKLIKENGELDNIYLKYSSRQENSY